MSALGQKQTYAAQKAMPAFPPIATAKADICPRPCPLYPQKQRCAAQRLMSALGQKRTSDDMAAEGGSSLLQGKPSSKCDENCTGGCLNCASDMRSIEPLSEATKKQNHC